MLPDHLLQRIFQQAKYGGGNPAKYMMDRSQLESKFNDERYKTFDLDYLSNLDRTEVRKEIIDELDNSSRCFIE